MKKICIIGMCFLAIFFLVGFAYAVERPASPRETAVKLKPDITITNLQITRTGLSPEGNNVRITVDLTNTVRGTSTGPFKVKVEWTEDPTVGWNYLNSGGVANLINDPSRASLPKATLYFDHVVPIGKAYKYRVTADYLNQVDESKEDNNVASAGYVAS